MKKISVLAIVAIASGMASCTAQSPKADMKNDVDSLAYAVGMSQTQGLKDYLVNRLNVDTTYMADFLKGLNEGAKASSKKDVAYYAGIQIGQQISNGMIKGINQQIYGEDSTKTINVDNFLSGFIAGTTGKDGKMTMDQAQKFAQDKMQELQDKQLEKKYSKNKADNEQFLAENKTKEGVVTLPDGLQYKIITAGNGAIPADTSKVKVNYKGTLIDGTVFDNSYERKEPTIFRANQVIKGWTEALTKMPVGSKWELYIPYDLAYGSREAGQIKPFSTLIFEVELLGIEK